MSQVHPAVWAVTATSLVVVAGLLAWWLCFLVGAYPPTPATCVITSVDRKKPPSGDIRWEWLWAASSIPRPRQLHNARWTTVAWRITWGAADQHTVLVMENQTWTPDYLHQGTLAPGPSVLLAGPWLDRALQYQLRDAWWVDTNGQEERVDAAGQHQVQQHDGTWSTVNTVEETWQTVSLQAEAVNFEEWGRRPLVLTWHWERALGPTPSWPTTFATVRME